MPKTEDKIRLVFFGSPEFAVPCLAALHQQDNFALTAVVTQPDKPAGRGLKLTASPVKLYAREHNLTLFQPSSLKGLELGADKTFAAKQEQLQEFCSCLNANPPDFFVVVAFGKIIPDALIDYQLHRVINVHPSLLPRWRGAAPLQHALFSGDTQTGVSIMALDAGLDTGPVFCQKTSDITAQDTLLSLHDRLAQLSAEILPATIISIHSLNLQPTKQPLEGATYAHKWDKADCLINWTDDAEVTLRRIRTCFPTPGARATFRNQEVKIYQASLATNRGFTSAPGGQIVASNKQELIVAAGRGAFIALEIMQFPGKDKLPIKEILKGYQIKVGESFS